MSWGNLDPALGGGSSRDDSTMEINLRGWFVLTFKETGRTLQLFLKNS
jgi:hypothetical protein